ncbi:M48 family metallopeptidase [Tahibacter sp.]|uniref:M48 family metallopeptidase n=1 Tax=Tahibacter sp. TaxID=2056211 RepID=UPI0028C49AB1|nr:M48 family metallopeptidase [Tahibacter sp.]
MDVVTVLILSAILTFFATNRFSEWMNVAAASQPVPAQLQEIYQPDHHQRSRDYLKQTAIYEFIKNFSALVCVLAFWFVGGFAAADNLLRSFGLSTLVGGTIFVVSYVLLIDLLKVPFYLYKLKIDREFGVGKTTPALFFVDYAKNFIGRLVMLPLPVFGILWIFEKMGSQSFLYVWLFVSVCGVFIQDVFLPLLAPLFNKYRSLEDGEIRTAVAEYAKRVNFRFKDIVVVDTSQRTAVAGAFLRGFGNSKSIVLNDNLIRSVSRDEMVAAVALAIGRDRFDNWFLGLIGTVGMIGIMFYLMSLFIWEPGIFRAFGVQQSVYLGLVFFSLVFPPVELGFSIVRNYMSRRTQAKADAFAASTTGNPDSVISALKKLSVTSLANLTPHPAYVLLNHAKPPLAQRLQSIAGTRYSSAATEAKDFTDPPSLPREASSRAS